ncbi:MAG: SDR family NAD(P)-dependent oxidoreductase [Candidatus Omnitrophica bacterium]|nr:SDR family NAD(P)-dependent oxidoreductase [Candidatus Omnitrophota bacterium]
MKNFYENKMILVTGGAGSIGSALVKKLLEYNPNTVRIMDTDETELFHLGRKLPRDKIRLLIGDIRDKERLRRAVEGIDIVFHSAALKHVPLCELNPFEAVQTNVLGTKNLIEAAMDEKIDRFITISTDKAVNPINVLGASKLLAERLTVSANLYKGERRTVFSCVRFGNVLNSRGSVLPLFKEQVKKGGPVTVTDGSMTRFVMSIDKATELVLKAAHISKGGETFILKMPALLIQDLAKAVIEEFAPKYGRGKEEVKIDFIGRRDGEKMHEELMNDDEAAIVNELDDMYILSTLNHGKHSDKGSRIVYRSNEGKVMAAGEIRELLKEDICE